MAIKHRGVYKTQTQRPKTYKTQTPQLQNADPNYKTQTPQLQNADPQLQNADPPTTKRRPPNYKTQTRKWRNYKTQTPQLQNADPEVENVNLVSKLWKFCSLPTLAHKFNLCIHPSLYS